MVKSLLESVLIIVLPFLLIFTLYRYCLGYNPLNMKAVITIFSDSFSSSRDYFSELAHWHANVMKEANAMLGDSVSIVSTGFVPFDNIVETVITGFVQTLMMWKNALSGIRVGVNFVVSLLGDFVGLLVALTNFIIDSSPYVIDPYFP